MDQLSIFFKKFKKFKIPHEEVRGFCVEYCNAFLKKKLNISDVRISGDIIYINTKSLLKGEIFLRKEDLLNELNKKTSSAGRVFKDVR